MSNQFGRPAEETDECRNERYAQIFKELDMNEDGIITVDDLTAAFNKTGRNGSSMAQDLLTRYDTNKDGIVDLSELVEYLTQHEQNLKLQFSTLDRNSDGVVEAEEIVDAFKKLGVEISAVEAGHLLKRMNADKSNKISWTEFRDFLVLRAASDMEEILASWRYATVIDVGDNLTVPDDFTEKEMKTGRWWRHLVAGGIAGAVSRTCTAPLDRIKVLLQVHGGKHNLGVISGFKSLLKEGGVKGLWRGNGVNIIKIAPESAIKFMAYEQMKQLLRSVTNKEELGAAERFVAGGSAGVISQTSIYPLEVVKTRLALMRTGEYNGIIDCGRKLFKAEGFGIFYRGYIPNIFGIIPYAGIDLMVYETLKNRYIASNPQHEQPDIMSLLLCGTISSSCGQLASYPLALIRTRMQAKPGKNQSLLGTARHIVQTDGLIGLYRGIVPNFMKVAPAVSISYVVYEHVKSTLGM